MAVKEERNPIDALFDARDDENIVLYDENDNPVEFEQIAIIPFEERVFAILKPADPSAEGVEDDEAVLFEVVENEEEEFLSLVDDEELMDKVFAEFQKLVESEGHHCDCEDCHDDNCDCGCHHHDDEQE